MRLLPLFLALTVTSTTYADIQCSGTVNRLLIYADGVVNISTTYRNDYTHICNLQTPRQGVDTLTCALWVGAIESARKLNQTIQVYYKTNNDFACDTIPYYASAPAPVYIGH